MKIKTLTIDELCNVDYGTRVTRKKDGGKIYPVYGGGGKTFFLDRANRKNRVIIARFGMSEKCTRIVDGEFFLNDSGLTLSPKTKELSQQYLDKIILTLNDSIYRLGKGTAQKNLDMKQFRLLKISFPESLKDQQNIVAKLEAVFTEINMAIDIEKRKEEEAIQLYRAISSEIFFKDEKKVSLNSVAKIIMGQSPKGESYNRDGEGVPLINGPVEFDKNSFGRSKSIKFTTKPTKFCEEGDALLCVRGSTTGRMNIANEKACIGRGVAAIRAKENQEWINYFIQSSRDYIYSIGTGATFPNVSSKQIEKIQIHFPDTNEQKKLVKKLKEAYRHVTNMSDAIQQSLKNYKKLKSVVLNQILLSQII